MRKYSVRNQKGRLIRLFIICFIASAFSQISFAQQSLIHENAEVNFRNALSLFGKEKYLPAQNYFQKSIEEIKNPYSEIRIDAEYYYALCAIELFHSDAAILLKRFIENHPESAHLVEAYFNLAKFQFRKKKYEDVLDYLNNIDVLDLEYEQRSEYFFKKGYAHFELDEFESAAKNFYEILDTDNPYVSAARYYYAHISYTDKKYETAATNFRKLNSDPQFGSLVPFYITQIFYLQKKYEQLIEYAPPVLDSAPPKREEEIKKLIGNSYYELGQYEKSVGFLSDYLKRNSGTVEDFYQLGFAYFKANKLEEAITYFQKAISQNDTISQNAYYYIGEANIKLDNKNAAKNAFRSASKIDVDKDIQEDALFNYAKAAYELSSHPYDNAILAFEEYINNYPKSTKISDAYEYLLGVYYTTKNYKEALKSLDRIKNKDIKLLEAKQRIAHYRAIELYQEKDYTQAIELFRISRENNYDPNLYSSSLYWMSEAFYHIKDYDNANDSYSEFLASSGAISLPFYAKAYYGLAYSNYKQDKYKGAIFWFREYIDNANPDNKGLINDALLRTGDAYFIQKDYRNAIEYYEKATRMQASNMDYAIMQSALSSGVLGKYQEKVTKLKRIIDLKASSVYKDDALFELGKTNLVLNKDDEALAYYNKLIIEYPTSTYLAEAYLKVGLINFNKQQDDIALVALDKVVKNFPSSNQSKEALDKIRKIYIDKADMDGFESYINGVPFADISKAKLDSTSYVIAENNYLAGNCEKATRDFSNYLARYPKGIFKLNAHFYRAECEAKAKFEQEALADYNFVINQPPNKFTEKSLLQVASLNRSLNKLDSAIIAYQKLLNSAQKQSNKEIAQVSLMEIYFELGKYKEASEFALKISTERILDVGLYQKAQMVLSKSAYEQENYDQAITHLDSLSRFSSDYGAEAKYMLARIYYLKGNYNKSDTLIYAIVDQVPSSPYWIAKGFILLADNFISKGDYYNARLTFESVIDNSDNKELIEIATEKLQILNQSEDVMEEKHSEPIEIIMDGENIKDESIFDLDDDNAKKNKNEK
ncbi:MAG: tetratricopeptide repeat protein [Bacteroidetes bacterium]|nr:MAG: tetratricopeptide repeat protein [Bacteroidota bacterium]MBL1145604.1 tetratricopeptide repeat protein [Bacteroidota bacterium]MCB0803146.1 tetratricopeptide repeat protein [Flavobacteriales bacterium]NOG58400.1 tetratricopeptide repeat protein [Bacteroidota bacterium]